MYTPRHYVATQNQCKSHTEPVTIKPDQVFKRDNLSMWIDTYYVDPNWGKVATLTQLTADSQVHNTQFDQDNIPPTSDQVRLWPLSGAITYRRSGLSNHSRYWSAGPKPTSRDVSDTWTKVSSDITPSIHATLKKFRGHLVTLPHVIYNLTTHTTVYIPKETIVAYRDEDEPEMDCFKKAETYEEAEEAVHYRNHLPHCPTLPVPPKSDLICSPAEVTFHRRVELKDHDASDETKQCFEELPEVFSKNTKVISKTNLITMDLDTGDSPPSAKKPYTLPLKHYNWEQQEIESLEWTGIISQSVSPWASPIIVAPKKLAPGEAPRRKMWFDFHAINGLQPTAVQADSKAKGNLTLNPLPNIDQLYTQLRGGKVITTLDLSSEYYHIELGKNFLCKDSICHPVW